MINFIFLKKHMPRWIILLIDLFIVFIAILLSYLLRFNFSIPVQYSDTFIYVFPIVLFVRLSSFLIARTYAGIIRYTSTRDAVRIFLTIIVGSIIFLIINLIHFFKTDLYFIPLSIVAIDFLLTFVLMLTIRLFAKTLYFENITNHNTLKNILIYGADEYGLITKRSMERENNMNYKIIAFIDDDGKGKKIDGVNIYSHKKLEKILKNNKISNIILAKRNNLKIDIKQKIIDICLNYNVKVLSVPQIDEWINGELSFNQIKKIKVEELLERPSIKLDEKQISDSVYGKTVLVTGAAGSIGSEIVRQLTRFKPKLIIAFDQAESPLYDLELELNEKQKYHNFEIVIGDVTNKIRVNKVFETFFPDVIFHAAAYKHVPMMENNPTEAIRTNVHGTKIIADLSSKNNVDKFVMVSTDKAVNPTNIMGASKRIAEIYTQSLNNISETKFITTRFGNVLGSNGSVIPRFKKQIENGGPVTVTHPEITRYFMTIPEACQLVLQAGALGKGGEIFIFDMGKSVKIANLAKKMIKLYGLTLNKDIEIKYTGLRPGEKLYEELLNNQENTIPTPHLQIMIAKVKKYNNEVVSKQIYEIINELESHENKKIVRLMKNIVPEFISKNSIYSELDEENNNNIKKKNLMIPNYDVLINQQDFNN